MIYDLKHNFLIVGFTGPLRSGCTTAANFFINAPQKEIEKYTLESEQTNIEETYKEIAALQIDTISHSQILKKKKSDLNVLLKKREIKKVLGSETIRPFYYISMSDMLLKYAVEYLHIHRRKKFNKKYRQLIDIIRNENLNSRLIKKINEKLNNKKFRSISSEECEFYDNFLRKISEIMGQLKKSIAPEQLGEMLQDLGDNIRRNGNPFDLTGTIKGKCISLISEQANRLIKFMRNRQDGPDRRRHHFVIECFRNPYEVEYFRYRYYEFYLFSVFAKRSEREGRENFSGLRDKRDRGEENKPEEIYKQNVSRCVYLSDIAINNNSFKIEFYRKLMNYYAIILRPGCITPSSQETFMNQAYSLSLRSGCISRQVGAVIIGKNGYVIGAGWNDVGEGQIGCGFRQVTDIKSLTNDILATNPSSDESFRRYISKERKLEDSFCFKDEYSLYELRKKLSKFMRERKKAFRKIGTREEQRKLIQEWLEKDIKIKRLEYCRALHAEENAILQTSKIGGMGVKDGTIYTTAFPCELCAKKIYQAGIKEIIYTEPYPESISKEVFLKDGIKMVKLTQFEGVKSHSYYRLYKASMDKKEIQILQKIMR